MDPAYQKMLDFDKAYWLAQPLPVQALQSTPADDGGQLGEAASSRHKLGVDLASKGFIIDVPIMIWGWDPFKMMTLREGFGYSTVPDALGNSKIKVSLNIADFPPITPPPPLPDHPAPTILVGPWSGMGLVYVTVAGDHSPDGTGYSDERGSFVKHVTQTPFGPTAYWQKV